MLHSIINMQKGHLSKRKTADFFGISKFTVAQIWNGNSKDNFKVRKFELMIKIFYIYLNSKATYGAERIQMQLRKEGEKVSYQTVLKYMRMLNIQSAYAEKKKGIKTSGVNSYMGLTNYIRYIVCDHLNQIWTQDITEIKTEEGKLYLASVMDYFSRKIICYNIKTSMEGSLVYDVLKKAISIRKPRAGIFIHSDKGSQYRSNEYVTIVNKIGGIRSYTRLEYSCYDNARQESFHATLKKECIYLSKIKTFKEAINRIDTYIKFYNNERMHSSLGNISPVEFENMNPNSPDYSNDINLAKINRIDLNPNTSDKEKNRMYSLLRSIGFTRDFNDESYNSTCVNFLNAKERKEYERQYYEKLLEDKTKDMTNKKLTRSFIDNALEAALPRDKNYYDNKNFCEIFNLPEKFKDFTMKDLKSFGPDFLTDFYNLIKKHLIKSNPDKIIPHF